MDLESEFSARESVEDNDDTPEANAHVDDIKIKNNGSYANEANNLSPDGLLDSELAPDMAGNNIGIGQQQNMPPPTANSPGLSGGPPQTTTKGKGLKKWKRIKRDFVRDTDPGEDSSKTLKRGSSTPANQTKPVHLSAENRQKSEGSVGSVTVLVKNMGGADYFPILRGSSLDSRMAVGSTFAASTDSDNSEDRSSKSSTAASAPKGRYDMPAVLGHARDKNKMKNVSGKSSGNSGQRIQQGKGWIETSKKPRGERVKIEKENSHSSMESDSRSSNFVFMQGAFSATNNGKHSAKSTNYNGENNDEAQASEQRFSEERQIGYSKENVGKGEHIHDDLDANLSWEAKEEKSENCPSSSEQDPLVDSVLMLRTAQEALEKELEKFREVGKVTSDSEIHASSSEQFGYEDNRQSDSCSFEAQVISLTHNVSSLESDLDQARSMLEAKESRIVELESTLNSSKPSTKEQEEESGSTKDEKFKEMEAEVESLLKQKIEAEVEYLAIIRTIEKLKAGAGKDQIALFEEQKSLAGEQAEMINKLEATENNAQMLKKQAQELEAYCANVIGSEEVIKMQKKVCKATSCFFIQLILLVIVIRLFVLKLSPGSSVVVPT